MGQCCTNEYQVAGEDFVNRILKDPVLKLNKYKFNELLNDIVEKRIQQEIHKKHVAELLIPSFYKKNESDKVVPYLTSIFNYILTQLDEKNNMYIVILYFYPFIDHEGEEKEKNMYNIFHYIAQLLTIKELENWLNTYILFCTKGLTYSIWKTCADHYVASVLDDLNTNIYNEENVKRLVDKMTFDIRKKFGNDLTQVVPQDLCEAMFKKWDISSAENVRAIMLHSNY